MDTLSLRVLRFSRMSGMQLGFMYLITFRNLRIFSQGDVEGSCRVSGTRFVQTGTFPALFQGGSPSQAWSYRFRIWSSVSGTIVVFVPGWEINLPDSVCPGRHLAEGLVGGIFSQSIEMHGLDTLSFSDEVDYGMLSSCFQFWEGYGAGRYTNHTSRRLYPKLNLVGVRYLFIEGYTKQTSHLRRPKPFQCKITPRIADLEALVSRFIDAEAWKRESSLTILLCTVCGVNTKFLVSVPESSDPDRLYLIAGSLQWPSFDELPITVFSPNRASIIAFFDWLELDTITCVHR